MNDDSDESEYVDDSEHKPVGRESKAKTTKLNRGRSKNVAIKQEVPRDSSAALEDQPNLKNIKDASTPKVKSDILRSYRDLLNANIAEVFESNGGAGSDALPPSQIGITFWTTKEKHRLFAAIQSHGPGDLSALATAVGTKAGPEIKAYILLLEEGVRELDAKATQQFGLADVPAAIETAPELLEAEEELSRVVECRARTAEEAREKQLWGEESWLIDEDVAAVIDERYESLAEEETRDDKAAAPHATSGDRQLNSRPLSADELLKPSTFLQLSRSLFMNSKNLEMNWHTISEEDESAPRPSIRRIAFDDFHNLVVSLTRRMIQASIFQAMCRLRASANTRLLPHVNGFDVAAARETMGLKTQRAEYWAAAVKRSGVDVYSESKKWKAEEGRQGTKNGVRLSEDELRAELGVLLPGDIAHANDVPDAEEDDEIVESSDSDAYTITNSSGDSDGELSDAEVAMDARGRILTDRRRPLSPASFNRAEAKYLQRVDRYNAGEPDNKYRHNLGLPVTAHKRTIKPGFAYKLAENETRPKDWRSVVNYEAPWEQPQGMPLKRDFDAMNTEGARWRKRRRLGVEKSGAPRLEDDHESQEDANVDSEVGDDTEAWSGATSATDSDSGSEEDNNSGEASERSSAASSEAE